MLSVIASEPLKVNNQDRRHVVNLDLFHSLFVGDTSVAIPGVCLRKVLWFVELSEAVLYAHIFGPVLHFMLTFEIRVFVLDEAV